jgi:peroxiredoxin 2/4
MTKAAKKAVKKKAPAGVMNLPRLGDVAPDFTAVTTHHSAMRFSKWQGESWVVLFSHPADFTPVCTSELCEFARRYGEFAAVHTKLIGLSLDSADSHRAWVQQVRQRMGVEIEYPIIADTNKKVSACFGMVHPGLSDSLTVRSVFVIDPQRRIQAMFYYPMNVGRGVEEVLRAVTALQTAQSNECWTPADWHPGDKVVVAPPTTVEDLFKRSAEADLKDLYLSLDEVPAGKASKATSAGR